MNDIVVCPSILSAAAPARTGFVPMIIACPGQEYHPQTVSGTECLSGLTSMLPPFKILIMQLLIYQYII